MNDIKIGDIVKIRKDSRHYNQFPNEEGVTSYNNDENYVFRVTFQDHASNVYRLEDLELVSKKYANLNYNYLINLLKQRNII